MSPYHWLWDITDSLTHPVWAYWLFRCRWHRLSSGCGTGYLWLQWPTKQEVWVGPWRKTKNDDDDDDASTAAADDDDVAAAAAAADDDDYWSYCFWKCRLRKCGTFCLGINVLNPNLTASIFRRRSRLLRLFWKQGFGWFAHQIFSGNFVNFIWLSKHHFLSHTHTYRLCHVDIDKVSPQ